MAKNIPTFFQDTVITAARSAEVPSADFSGGVNKAGCNPGVGINTNDFDPKVEDWPDSTFNGADPIPYFGESSYIGIDSGANNRITLFKDGDENNQPQFVVAQQDTAPDAGLGAAGAEPINRTGKTVPNGSRVWGDTTVV